MTTGAASRAAPLIEIFASVQGEGRFAGVPMAFVRTAVCPIRCLYCDTPESYAAPPAFSVRGPGGAREAANPAAGERAAALVAEVGVRLPANGRRVSVTGGEPLLYPAFVADFGAAARARGFRVHLETAALHPAALRSSLGAIDHLSADYKLPATLERGDFRERHRECIALGVEAGLSVDVKVVITPAVAAAAVAGALDHLADLRGGFELILQPVTPFGAVRERPAAALVADLADLAGSRGFQVRVLPQVHKTLGVD